MALRTRCAPGTFMHAIKRIWLLPENKVTHPHANHALSSSLSFCCGILVLRAVHIVMNFGLLITWACPLLNNWYAIILPSCASDRSGTPVLGCSLLKTCISRPLDVTYPPVLAAHPSWSQVNCVLIVECSSFGQSHYWFGTRSHWLDKRRYHNNLSQVTRCPMNIHPREKDLPDQEDFASLICFRNRDEELVRAEEGWPYESIDNRPETGGRESVEGVTCSLSSRSTAWLATTSAVVW